MDEDLRKFLTSDYGQKLINLARLHGKNEFKYGKKTYDIEKLLFLVKVANAQNNTA